MARPGQGLSHFIGDILKLISESDLGGQLKQFSSALPNSEVIALLQKPQLNIFLGAGVSFGYGIPTWRRLVLDVCEKRMSEDWKYPQHPKLLRELLDVRFERDLGFSPLVQARFATGDGDTQKFRHWLHSAMYSGYEEPTEPSNIELLAALAKARGSGTTFITYNYDDIVEGALKRLSVPFVSIFNAETWEENAEADNIVKIIHIHGFVPRNDLTPEDQSIVMSEHEYNKLMSSSSDWRNVVQAKYYARDFLMIGISLTDPNMRRLLDEVRGHSQTLTRIIAKSYDKEIEDKEIKKLAKRYRRLQKGRKKKGQTLLPNRLTELEQAVFRPLQACDFHTFGLKTWWVGDWSHVGKQIEIATTMLTNKADLSAFNEKITELRKSSYS